MSIKTYKTLRILVAIFVSVIVGSAAVTSNYLLAIFGVLTGMIFMFVIKKKTKGILVDERTQLIGDKAARASYLVTTLTLAAGSFALTFAPENLSYLKEMSGVFSYLTLFAISVYSVAFSYYDKKYGNKDEE